MAKTILKEGGIVILLLLAIGLVLGIIFYDYIPSSKTIPAKIETYAFPEDIKEELSESMDNIEQNIVRTYYIDSQDLSLYEVKKEYNKGKVNPFADTSTQEQTSDGSGSSGGGSSSSGTTTGGGSSGDTSSSTPSGTGGSSRRQ